MERRRSGRHSLQVDIEMTGPGKGRCFGYVEDISVNGVSIRITSGYLENQFSVVLNFRIWTGTESLFRKVYARVVRTQENLVALEFSEHDVIAEAIVQDLIYYHGRDKSAGSGSPSSTGEYPAPELPV